MPPPWTEVWPLHPAAQNARGFLPLLLNLLVLVSLPSKQDGERPLKSHGDEARLVLSNPFSKQVLE